MRRAGPKWEMKVIESPSGLNPTKRARILHSPQSSDCNSGCSSQHYKKKKKIRFYASRIFPYRRTLPDRGHPPTNTQPFHLTCWRIAGWPNRPHKQTLRYHGQFNAQLWFLLVHFMENIRNHQHLAIIPVQEPLHWQNSRSFSQSSSQVFSRLESTPFNEPSILKEFLFYFHFSDEPSMWRWWIVRIPACEFPRTKKKN